MYLALNWPYMAAEGEQDTTRAHVQTYVPAYQKEKWARDADELDMSLSEFVRSMVQAGRSDFSPDIGEAVGATSDEAPADPSSGPDSGGEGLEDRVAEILAHGEFYDWDELVAALTDDVEDRLEATLQELQAENRVRYSGRNGGYTLE